MRLNDVVEVSRTVAATRSRLAKREAIAALLRATPPDNVELVVAYLAGALPQRRTGLGWRSLGELPAPAAEPSLEIGEVDAALERISQLAGSGSASTRADAAAALFARATADEQAFLRSLIVGELRQGALDAVMLDAIADASGVPATSVRRAAMLAGATAPVAVAALTRDREAVEAFTLTVGTPVRPMLASSAPDVPAAFDKIGARAAVDVKLDGIRIQAHKRDGEVSLYTRSLDDITDRLAGVAERIAMLPYDALILDGEVIALDDDGRPRPFQDTASRTATHGESAVTLAPFFFDCLHLDEDLIDRPLGERIEILTDALPDDLLVPRLITDDARAAEAFFTDMVDQGQEGVVVKTLDAPYEAGRRGAGWVKVKPRHTLDLVVLAVEWGNGRRQGWLSNIHLGARDADGGFVMLGKTFKGMTDEMLTWQTERFLELEESRDRHIVYVRPEQVVEIAFDGLQRSTRYPGGLALRFARVLRYRDDKSAEEADTIDRVRELA
ncbi:ATP-dependent DNA ligase [Solicola gregarius]|uniref:DNA ligase n=1 Tax=Solicola gregarius TaxID=2908642 RepID=A0AA46TLC4_9ACTN|nr:ATP-dependent DNA ligase [Solicola gregarius]UYM07205.1 ATP-dependent DNA ligase [Solicola gregarius]